MSRGEIIFLVSIELSILETLKCAPQTNSHISAHKAVNIDTKIYRHTRTRGGTLSNSHMLDIFPRLRNSSTFIKRPKFFFVFVPTLKETAITEGFFSSGRTVGSFFASAYGSSPLRGQSSSSKHCRLPPINKTLLPSKHLASNWSISTSDYVKLNLYFCYRSITRESSPPFVWYV